MDQTLVNFISGLLIVLGTLGAVLPILPGLPVAWLGLLIFAWSTDFQIVGALGLVVFGVLVGLTMAVDLFAPAIAARGYKASRYGVWGAIIGGFAGIFLMGPLGIIVGPFAGAFIGEIMNNAKTERALQVAVSSLFGLVIGSIFKLIIGMGMFVYFLVRLL